MKNIFLLTHPENFGSVNNNQASEHIFKDNLNAIIFSYFLDTSLVIGAVIFGHNRNSLINSVNISALNFHLVHNSYRLNGKFDVTCKTIKIYQHHTYLRVSIGYL